MKIFLPSAGKACRIFHIHEISPFLSMHGSQKNVEDILGSVSFSAGRKTAQSKLILKNWRINFVSNAVYEFANVVRELWNGRCVPIEDSVIYMEFVSYCWVFVFKVPMLHDHTNGANAVVWKTRKTEKFTLSEYSEAHALTLLTSLYVVCQLYRKLIAAIWRSRRLVWWFCMT